MTQFDRQSDVAQLLARFPKSRPHLRPAKAAEHKALLKANRERGTPLTMMSHALESWMHRRVARCNGLPPDHTMLEIGAGTLNHVPFEQPGVIFDAVEPFSELYETKPARARIRQFFDSVERIALGPSYDRIISVASLEHLTDLPAVVARAGLLLKTDGVFSSGIPSEGGFLWGLAWRLTFAVAHRLLTQNAGSGLTWSEHMRYEHVNTAPEIIAIIRHFFAEVEIRRFPLPLHHLSFYAAIEARAPRQEICCAYLEARGADIRN